MVEVHAAFHIVRNKKHVTVVDEDNGVSVASDLDYVVRQVLGADLVTMRSGFTPKVILRDAFGAFDVIDFDGSKQWWQLRGLDAKSEDEALRAA